MTDIVIKNNTLSEEIVRYDIEVPISPIQKRRIKKAEYQRKWRANLSEEQREKIAESVQKRRIKNAEYMRKKRSTLTDEQRLERAEYDRKRRENLTDEQRQKNAEIRRKWLANKTEEQHSNNTEKQHSIQNKQCTIKSKNEIVLTDEQRTKNAEYQCNLRANLTDEVRQQRSEYNRRWRENLSKTQNMKSVEYNRIQSPDLTKEQRKKRAENKRKWKAKLTKEQRGKLDEYYLKRFATLSNEQRSKYYQINSAKKQTEVTESSCESQCNLSKPDDQSGSNKKESIQKQDSECRNTLQSLIQYVIRCNKNLNMINTLDINLFQRIFKIFSIDYPENMFLQNNTIQRFNYEIDVNMLIILLKKWIGWKIHSIEYLISNKGNEDLFLYLNDNFINVQSWKDKYLLDELNNFTPPENYISVSCSLKQLKTLFYHNPHNYIEYYNEKSLISGPTLNTGFPDYIFNLPFISTQISFHNFSMTHKNIHDDEYHLLNITNELKLNSFDRDNVDLFVKIRIGKSRYTFLSDFVLNFLDQLKNTVYHIDSISSERKSEISSAIIEFENDVALCSNMIETNTKYHISLTRHPYARYFGHSEDGNINMSLSDQKSINDPKFNIRLLQSRQPKISFNLNKFSVPYEDETGDVNFIFDELFLSRINNCISYKCILCNVYLGPHSPSQKISEHVLKYHGIEPDWECTKCSKQFDNEYLLKHRWQHDCNNV